MDVPSSLLTFRRKNYIIITAKKKGRKKCQRN
nr:MAG TPA: hypothetical protein [Caudoviricetes sp.]